MLVVLTAILTLYLFTGDARLVEDIKLFDVVDLSGINETKGYHSNSKAYEFTATTGDLVAFANVSTQFAKEVFLINQFTVKAYLLPAVGSKGGTIVFFSRGKKKGAAFNVVYEWKTNTQLKVGSEFYIKDNAGTVLCDFDNVNGIPRDAWIHLDVRVHIQERLIRCEIGTDNGKKFYRYDGKTSTDSPFDKFPLDGRLRLAQQYLTGSESILTVTERFVGKLQDVIISFGDPNCTITIEDNYVPATTTPNVCSTSQGKVKDDTCLDANNKQRNDGAEWKEGKWVECKCNKGKTYCIKSGKRCLSGGIQYPEGAIWYDSSNCDKCACVDGVTNCESTERVWKYSGCERTCSNTDCLDTPRGGCFCPGRKVLLDGKCVDRLACPCERVGKRYRAGTYKFNCDMCFCRSGKFKCYSNAYC